MVPSIFVCIWDGVGKKIFKTKVLIEKHHIELDKIAETNIKSSAKILTDLRSSQNTLNISHIHKFENYKK